MDPMHAGLGRHALLPMAVAALLGCGDQSDPDPAHDRTRSRGCRRDRRGGVHPGQRGLLPNLRRRHRPPRLLLGARRPRSGRGSGRPPLAPAQRRRWPCLRARHRQPGVLLGLQLLGAARRWHHDRRRAPVPVFGGRRFRSIRAGGTHTCAVTFEDQAYCWGDNCAGQTGDSSTANRRQRPVLVAGQHAFRQVVAGWAHTCGVTTGNKAFCWGYGASGRIGDGKTIQRNWPRAVAGGLSFRVIAAGSDGSCGITARRPRLLLGHQRARRDR